MEDLIKYVDDRIERMLKRPLMWAGNLESLEMQLLTHFEFREQLTGTKRDIKREWVKFFHGIHPDDRPFYLNSILTELKEDETALVDVAKQFYEQFVKA